MTDPVYYVISAADFASLLNLIISLFVLFAVIAWALSVDWLETEWRIRRYLRARRLRRIRDQRIAALWDDLA